MFGVSYHAVSSIPFIEHSEPLPGLPVPKRPPEPPCTPTVQADIDVLTRYFVLTNATQKAHYPSILYSNKSLILRPPRLSTPFVLALYTC